MASLTTRLIARHPVPAFLSVAIGVAFAVTAATAGQAGVVDLARRSLRWRVPVSS
jgi:hypothetical protein